MILLLPMLAAVIMAWSPAPARAEPAELAGMLLILPEAREGWSRNPTPPGLLSLRRELPRAPDGRGGGGNALIVVAAPRAPTGVSFADAFAAFARLETFPQDRPLQTRQGVTVNGHAALWAQRCCRTSNRQYGEAHFVGIDSPRGAIFAMLVMVGMRSQETASLEADFAALIRSLRPSPGDRPLDFKPLGREGGLSGVYTSLFNGIRPNVFGGTDFYSENRIMAFEPNGLYARQLPAADGELSAFCRQRPRECGFYHIAGGQVVLLDVVNDYGILDRQERPLQRDGETLVIGRERWRAVPGFAADARLAGSWRHLYASSGQTAFGSGGVSSERWLTLTPDGRFTRTGSSSVATTQESGGSRTGVVAGSRRPVMAGRYRLEGYRLSLTGEDGATETLSIIRPDGQSDRLLVIAGNNYLRRDTAPAPRPPK